MPSVANADLDTAPMGLSYLDGSDSGASPLSGRGYVRTVPIGSDLLVQQAWVDRTNLGAFVRWRLSGVWTSWQGSALLNGDKTQPFAVEAPIQPWHALRLDSMLGRQAVITASGSFTPTYTGQYMCMLLGGGGGAGGAAGNVAGASSAAGRPGAGGQLNLGLLPLTGGLAYTMTVGVGGDGGLGGSNLPNFGSDGGWGGLTEILDDTATSLMQAGGGVGGAGGDATDGVSPSSLSSVCGGGYGGGAAAPRPAASGGVGQSGGNAQYYGGGGGPASGNWAPAAATAGEPGGAGYGGVIVLIW